MADGEGAPAVNDAGGEAGAVEKGGGGGASGGSTF
jgi:hypothetical protein